MNKSEQDKITQRFMERLGLAFSSDPDAECNRESLKKLAQYISQKMQRSA